MTDIVSSKVRSKMMSAIRSSNTKPELLIRKALHAKGFRYRLHVKGLPGKPDLVFHKHKAVVFINGCFWHGHNCHLFKWPKTRSEFWESKIKGNKVRDSDNVSTLLEQDWRVAVIWECSIKGKYKLDFIQMIENISLWLLNYNNNKLEIRSNE